MSKRWISGLVVVAALVVMACGYLAASDVSQFQGVTGKIGSEDIYWGTGAENDTFDVPTYSGGTVTLTKVPSLSDNTTSLIKGTWYLSSSDSITDHSDTDISGSLAWVIAQIGSDSGHIIIPPGTYAIGDDLSVSDNIKLTAMNGAVLEIASGKTLTLSAPESIVASCEQQIFDGDGSVVFSRPGVVCVDWWGAVPDGATDSAAAINAALNCMPQASPDAADDIIGGTVRFNGGIYSVASALLAEGPGLNIVGVGSDSTTISATAALDSGTVLTLNSKYDSPTPGWQIQNGYTIRDLAIITNDKDTSGIEVAQTFLRRNIIENVRVEVPTAYMATNTGTGIHDAGESAPGFSNGVTVRNCDIWGFKYGVRITGAAGGTYIVRNHLQGLKTVSGSTGVYIETGSGSQSTISDNYFESWDYAIKNYGGYWTTVSHNIIESGSITTAEYDDNGSGTSREGLAQAYLLSNGWQDCSMVSADWSTIRNEPCAHVVSGRKTSSGQTTQYGTTPSVSGVGAEQTDKTVYLYKLGGIYQASGSGALDDPFGAEIAENWYHGYLASQAYSFSMGTTENTSHPVQFYTGSELRGKFGANYFALYPSDGGTSTFEHLFKMYNTTGTDAWGRTCNSESVKPYYGITSPYHITIGPTGENNNHLTEFMAYDTAALGRYAPLKVNGHGVHWVSANVPSAASDTCTKNQMAWDDNGTFGYIYMCVDTNTWRRVKIETW